MAYVPGAQVQRAGSELDRLRKTTHRLMQERENDRATIARLREQLAAVTTETRPYGSVKCGTHAGYTTHLRNDETPCPPCKTARAIYQREYRKRKDTPSGTH